MSDDKIIEIVAADCNNKPNLKHNACPSMWEGFGFVVCCKCKCHKKIKRMTENV